MGFAADVQFHLLVQTMCDIRILSYHSCFSMTNSQKIWKRQGRENTKRDDFHCANIGLNWGP